MFQCHNNYICTYLNTPQFFTPHTLLHRLHDSASQSQQVEYIRRLEGIIAALFVFYFIKASKLSNCNYSA